MSFLINPYISFPAGAACSGSLISTTNLQVYYKFDNNALDASDNDNDGTATSITYGTGKFDNAAVFNGTTSNVKTPSIDYAISNGYTLSAWINTTSTSEQHIITSDNPSTPRRNFQFRIDATTGVLRVVRFQNNTTLVSNFTSTAAVNTGNWVHVAMVFDNTVGSKIYINGSVDGSDSVTTNNNSTTDAPIVVGAQQGASLLFPMNGSIDEAVVYNRALSSTEIADLAAGTCPLISGTIVSGGTVTESGGYTYHTFTSTDTLYVEGDDIEIDFLIVAGGGGGGGSRYESGQYYGSGGGGAGGYRAFTSNILTAGNYTITVGGGGNGGNGGVSPTFAQYGSNGNNSSFSGITSTGGGGGAGRTSSAVKVGNAGGSGGGGLGNAANTGAGGAASPAGQGNAGGTSSTGRRGAGGGGGAGAAGGTGQATDGGDGGIGSQWLNGTYYAGGGGAGEAEFDINAPTDGGIGGGGAGGNTSVGTAGTANTGGGGGGGGANAGSGVVAYAGGNGGSGVVIIRYVTPA